MKKKENKNDITSWTKKGIRNSWQEFITLQVVTSVIGFIFSLFFMIWLRYKQQSVSYTLEKNLPAISLPTQKLSWETFDNILSKKIFSENSFSRQRDTMPTQINVFQDSMSISMKPYWNKKETYSYFGFFPKSNIVDTNLVKKDKEKIPTLGPNWFIIDSRQFMGFIPNPNSDTHSSQKSFLKKNNLTTKGVIAQRDWWQDWYSRLDELPSKLEENYFFSSNSENSILIPSKHYSISIPEKRQVELENDKKMTGFHENETNLVHLNGPNDLLKEPTNFIDKINKPVGVNFKNDKFNNIISSRDKKKLSVKKLKVIKNNFSVKFLPIHVDKINENIKFSAFYQKNFQFNPLVTKLEFYADFLSKTKQNKILHAFLEPRLIENAQNQNVEKENIFITKKNRTPISNVTTNANDSQVRRLKNSTFIKSKDFESITHRTNFYKKSLVFYKEFHHFLSKKINKKRSDLLWQQNPLIQPRMMTGFLYPDMDITEVKKFVSQLYYQNNTFLWNPQQTHSITNNNHIIGWNNLLESRLGTVNTRKIKNSIINIDLPSYFLKPSNYLLPTGNKLSYDLRYKETNFSNKYQTSKSLFEKLLFWQQKYKTIGLVKDSRNQDINPSNQEQVEEWLYSVLSTENSLSDKKQGFFGKNLILTRVKNLLNRTPTAKIENHLDLKQNVLTESFLKNSPNIRQELIEKFAKGWMQSKGITGYYENLLTDSRFISPKTTNFSNKFKSWNSTFDTITYDSSVNNVEQNKLPFFQLIKQVFERGPLTKRFEKPYCGSSFKISPYKDVRRPILPSWQDYQFVYMEKPEWEHLLAEIELKLKKWQPDFQLDHKNFSRKNNLDLKWNDFLPLVKIRQPKSKMINRPIWFLDYQPLFQKPNNQTSLNLFPYSFDETSLLSKSYGKTYKRFNSIYQKPFINSNSAQENQITEQFYERWEPITIWSWMVFIKIIYLLGVVKMVESIYKNYGKEVVTLLLDSITSSGIADQGFIDELGFNNSENQFRLFRKISKRFQDVGGIDGILPQLGETVWFLRSFRNKGPVFQVGKRIPKKILFVGPPGTGKTLLVKAIAGEAEVPVLVQSASTLTTLEGQDKNTQKGSERLKQVFEKARELAPCIVFIDEIDTLGETRENIITNSGNSASEANVLDLVLSTSKNESTKFSTISHTNSFFHDTHNSDNNQVDQGGGALFSTENRFDPSKLKQKITTKKKNLGIFFQFLVELDGLQPIQGVVVIGATNRPRLLDLALTRPGRFDQILNLDLPGKKKRIEILKLYSQNLGYDFSTNSLFNKNGINVSSAMTASSMMQESQNKVIPKLLPSKTLSFVPNKFLSDTFSIKEQEIDKSWDYLGNRTAGLSAAHLAAAMNESSIQAILKNTVHTVETIEKGIDSVTTYTLNIRNEKQKNYQDPFFLTRRTFYQAGKAVLYTFLPNHPPAIVLSVWPRPDNARQSRQKNSLTSLIGDTTSGYSRVELETRLIGFFAGKAAEFLALSVKPDKNLEKTTSIFNKNAAPNDYSQKEKFNKEKLSLWHSDLGKEDLYSATFLAEAMIDSWYFYSKKIVSNKFHQLKTNKNYQEIHDNFLLTFFKQLGNKLEKQVTNQKVDSVVKMGETTIVEESSDIFQNWFPKVWCQSQITHEIERFNSTYQDWYRIYLPDPQENERNQEWVPPDQYYHNNNFLKNLLLQSKRFDFQWNNFYHLNRDYIYQGLIMKCFHKAFSILDENRELLDYFAHYLLRFEIIRQYEITDIISNFQIKSEGND